MFSLIITIISIALVAALALATLYYGGDAFNQGKAGADASRLINEGQQVNAAVTLARATGVTPLVTTADLVSGGVLSQLPAAFSTASNIDLDRVTVESGADVCEEVQARAGVATPDVFPTAAPTGQLFGCIVDDATTPTAWTFYYNF